jgi:hypothetical protein
VADASTFALSAGVAFQTKNVVVKSTGAALMNFIFVFMKTVQGIYTPWFTSLETNEKTGTRVFNLALS